MGEIVPAEITIYADGSFTFILKTPPASILLKKAAGVEKGSSNPPREIVGQVTKAAPGKHVRPSALVSTILSRLHARGAVRKRTGRWYAK